MRASVVISLIADPSRSGFQGVGVDGMMGTLIGAVVQED